MQHNILLSKFLKVFMARKKHLVNKKAKKKGIGKCRFCDCSVYEYLDLHRITEGKDGGVYSDQNTIVVCRLHHQQIHQGKIKIDRQYPSILGKWILHYWIDGIEHWN
jgi:hypothetical protein